MESSHPYSSPAASSPNFTPYHSYVNLVSSPGPMAPLPEEKDYDKLPFILPPEPYSQKKPEVSYAALIGQAILSSSEHRLTLQEIYDWITIVYPYFKRGEQTWMNSIRHVLSTTVCFRKVTRDRSLGRTQWAIFDEDLECFRGGGFRKQLCKDFMKGTSVKEKQHSKGKWKGRVRGDFDVDDREVKRCKKRSPYSVICTLGVYVRFSNCSILPSFISFNHNTTVPAVLQEGTTVSGRCNLSSNSYRSRVHPNFFIICVFVKYVLSAIDRRRSEDQLCIVFIFGFTAICLANFTVLNVLASPLSIGFELFSVQSIAWGK